MASCLFECLCEADLDRYFPHFVAVGLQRIEQLAKVTMKDYSRLGVHSMDDRKRLFQLIKIIQSVSEEESHERTPLQPGCVYLQPALHRFGTRRQLHFDSPFEMGRNVFTPSGLCDSAEPCPAKRPGELCETHPPPTDPHHTGKIPASDIDAESSCQLKGQDPKPFCGKRVAASIADSETPVIQRVTHVSGYNYGVPQTCSSRSSTSEKNGPWTETEKIRVCVRKRPLGVREERRGETSVVTVENDETILIHEKKEAVNLKEYILQHVFYFDEVFSETLSNRDVYVKTAHPLIQHVFSGGNATCFAYGQTGAGKTYTMIGTQKNPGLYALAAKDIFQQLEADEKRKDRSVWISFYEIYCGQLYDLLNGRKRLFAREDGKHIVQIVGLRDVQVRSVDLLLEMMQGVINTLRLIFYTTTSVGHKKMILKGSKERSTGATGVNSDSSRSHAVIQIQIKDAGNRKMGRISFIDLAGSERASDARESDKQTKMEGAEINQSLLALKECIRALDQEQAHTPFRQSKLTQVLKDSFIGNSKTCMIANVSPSHIATEHTLNTLRYADRVKELKKRMKSSCINRSRAAVCLSPKRLQNSLSVLGEKISPKKVKLGQQPTSVSSTAKANPCPSVFLPANVPLSSTPKTHSKATGNKGSQAWLGHTTPVKGIISVAKKKSEVLLDKCHLGIKAEMAIPFRDIGREDPFPCGHSLGSTQKIQAVQPVQKQIVSRPVMSPGDQNYKSPSCDDQNTTNNSPLGTDSVHLASKWAQQKERERHLRSYHQQIQHPPILQQKLHYQPLEKILDLYKPQEIGAEKSSSPPPPSPYEAAHFEDYDDSDFSEDSFSYASTHKKDRKLDTAYERLSFFLHPESAGPEIRKPTEKEERLCFSHGESQDSGKSCDSTSVSPRKNVDVTEKTNLWSSQETSRGVCDSSKNCNTPEKPYSSQEDLASHLKKPKPPSSTSNEDKDSSGCSSDLSSSQETDWSRSVGTAEKRSSGSERNGETCDLQRTSSGSVSGLMTPLTLSLLQDNWSMELVQLLESQESSDRSSSDAKSFNCDKDWTLGDDLDPDNSRPSEKSLENNLFGFVKQMLYQNESVNLSISPKVIRLTGAHSLSSSLGSAERCKGPRTPENISQETNVGPSSVPRSSTPPCSSSSSEFAVGHYGEHQANRCYKADTERSPVKLQNGESSPRCEEHLWNKPGGCYVESGELKSTSPSNASPKHLLKMVTNVSPKSSSLELNHGPQTKTEEAETSFKDHFKLPINDSELEHLKSKLIKCIFSNSVGEEQVPSFLHPRTQNSSRHCTDGSSSKPSLDLSTLQARHLEKAQQLVVQAHRHQLDEIVALCSREETLLSQMPYGDFKEYVAKLDEILSLKSKCIHSMRTQLQLFTACPRSAESADRTATSS